MMDKLQSWSQELETGIQVVDKHHMEFFKRLNTFILRVRGGQISTAQAACEQMDYYDWPGFHIPFRPISSAKAHRAS